MEARSFITTAALVAVLPVTALYAGQPQNSSDQEWRPFVNAVQEYIVLQHAVKNRVGPPRIAPDPREVWAAVDALGAGIKAARPQAKAGEILGGDTAALLRARIAHVVREQRLDPSRLLAAAAEDQEHEVPPRPIVNERYSWSWPSFAPPSILAALPHLPEELQYRFVGRDLVLVDIEASIIVDVLSDALPTE